jgi:hypothetical protein
VYGNAGENNASLQSRVLGDEAQRRDLTPITGFHADAENASQANRDVAAEAKRSRLDDASFDGVT